MHCIDNNQGINFTGLRFYTFFYIDTTAENSTYDSVYVSKNISKHTL